jgi:hypothetical protein
VIYTTLAGIVLGPIMLALVAHTVRDYRDKVATTVSTEELLPGRVLWT